MIMTRVREEEEKEKFRQRYICILFLFWINKINKLVNRLEINKWILLILKTKIEVFFF